MGEEPVKSNSKNGTDAPKINEPSEADPCMIEFKNSFYKPKFLENTVRRGCEKTGFTPIGVYIAAILLILLIILLIVVLVLAITWPRQPHHLQFPVCEKPACLRAAAQIQENWNSSISPCQNVWQWACNGWLNKNSLPSGRSLWSIHEQVKLEEFSRIHDYISTLELPLYSQMVEWKMKYLYEGCLNIDNINVDKATPLVHIISQFEIQEEDDDIWPEFPEGFMETMDAIEEMIDIGVI
ncbi:hypothetical protein RN001_010038 [Aquatica leii]|uniref:Peptidase M13 N-terminal domain-containing protein n=1 Tax=Aquatica leii TaxID=1421715 RepID=A0AAN7SE78_9COLE|nr:hypothetical protein RN001_010038 [Aquatica leii]